MDQDTYVVSATEKGWTIVLNGQVLASGMERSRAEQAAAVAARLSRQRGRTAEILIDGAARPPVSLGGLP